MDNILIVDDEKIICSFLTSHFSKSGFNVSVAHDGAQALKLIEENHFNIIITDIRMPKVGGAELIRKVTSRKDKHQPIIICISAFSDYSISDGFDLGISAFLSKPFKIKDLISVCNRFLNQNKQLEESELVNNLLLNEWVLNESLINEINEVVTHTVRNELAYIKSAVEFTTEKMSAHENQDQKINMKHLNNLTSHIDKAAATLSFLNLFKNKSSENQKLEVIKSIISLFETNLKRSGAVFENSLNISNLQSDGLFRALKLLIFLFQFSLKNNQSVENRVVSISTSKNLGSEFIEFSDNGVLFTDEIKEKIKLISMNLNNFEKQQVYIQSDYPTVKCSIKI